MTQVSVVIASYNTREYLRACLNSLKSTLPQSSDVIVVDNASRDGSARMVVEEFQHVRIVRNPRNFGLAHALNQGIERARGAYVLFLNADTEIIGAAVKQMVAFLEQNLRYGAVAPRLVGHDGGTQRAHMRFPNLFTPLFYGTPAERWFPNSPELRRYFARDFNYDRDGDVQQPASVCLLMRRRALKREQTLDESLRVFFCDVDLCKRLRGAGWRIRYLSEARVLHHGSVSARRLEEFAPEWHDTRLAYYRKHYGKAGGWWVKACVGWAVVDHCVHELWRRAHGAEEEPLTPVWQTYTVFLRH
jgi:hypothetical protein